MAKAKRLIKNSVKLVDAVVEVIDARIPISSRNPELDELTASKPRIIVLNKSDMADENATSRWIEFFKKNGSYALSMDSRNQKNAKRLIPVARQALSEQLERWANKGYTGRGIRLMVVGIPNVGKSSLINSLAGSKRAKVEDRPGVTRGGQWVMISSDAELLDMPGILWPKFESRKTGLALAFTGAIKDDIMDIESLSCELINCLKRVSPNSFAARYRLEPKSLESLSDYELLEAVGKSRGFLASGGAVNTERAAAVLLDEFRSGRLGRITLEEPYDGAL